MTSNNRTTDNVRIILLFLVFSSWIFLLCFAVCCLVGYSSNFAVGVFPARFPDDFFGLSNFSVFISYSIVDLSLLWEFPSDWMFDMLPFCKFSLDLVIQIGFDVFDLAFATLNLVSCSKRFLILIKSTASSTTLKLRR